MNILRLCDDLGVPDAHSFSLVYADNNLGFYRGEELIDEAVVHSVKSTKLWSIECIQFLTKKLELFPEIKLLSLGHISLGFMINYAHRELSYPYVIDGISSIPTSEWYLAFNCSGFKNTGDLLKSLVLPESYSCSSEKKELVKVGDDELNILIVAYYCDPFGGVGAKRPTFLNQFFNSVDGVSSKLVGAISSDSPDIDMVPDYGFDAYNQIDDVDIQTLSDEGISIIGSSWIEPLRIYLDGVFLNRSVAPDAIIFSGNPFYYFKLSRYVKNRYGVMLILDYRDPFANNPLMLRSSKVKDLQKRLESSFNRMADLVCVVNQPCLDLLESRDETNKPIVVENGYDERLYQEKNKNPDKDGLTFVYAGSFSKFRNGENFELALKSTSWNMNYLGSDGAFGVESSQITRFGHVQIATAAKVISSSDVGVVFATGEEFESTTKVYDYIGADLPILIVTNGAPRTGALNDLVGNLDEVYWVENDVHEIEKFLSGFSPVKPCRDGIERYSRGYQASLLLDEIKGALDE